MGKVEKAVYGVAELDGVFRVLRNERALVTPEGKPFDLPSRALAALVAEEWSSQTEKINPATMPMTQLSATSLDIVPKMREKILGGLTAYTKSELLCHRAERPDSLVKRQNDVWGPVLEWFAGRYGVSLTSICGVMPAGENEQAGRVVRDVLAAFDDFRLAGTNHAADSAGSLVLGLALCEGHLTAAQVFEASELDVLHQGLTWGDDPVTQGRQKAVRFDLECCEKWFSLLQA